ncbi:MAG: dehydrogenase [Candidatus Hydrogenedens sp.]|nr:dehydrogenase [Candidatus Hydrogenedens sp.]
MNTPANTLTFSAVEPNAGLWRALEKPRADVIAEIAASGLKGRGGAGFPTSVKWNLAAAAYSEHKFIVCNADEGEPGTFKDRLILSEHGELVIEGMTIAAHAIGANHGIIYLRGEYAYLRGRLEAILARRREQHRGHSPHRSMDDEAIRARRHEHNLLGKNILGNSGFNFDIEIRMGSGAYVCGEETALIESLEGQRGEPRNRPPFPVDTGYMGHPTVVNNVETLAWATCVMARGAEWFKSIGTERSPGPKIFSVSGDCARPGVYEFPMGITLVELLKEVGAEDAKAVQVGGASGRCVPAAEFTRTLAFEDVPTGGSIIVFGRGRDMLAVARNFLEFFVEESCGQCTPCREGNAKLLEGVELLEKGRCSMAYLRELCRLGETMQLASKCGLGQSSPNAFLSIVEKFKDELMGRTGHGAALS